MGQVEGWTVWDSARVIVSVLIKLVSDDIVTLSLSALI